MAESDGVIDATTTEFGRHPWLIVGGIGAVVVLLYVLSGSKSSAAPAAQFSYNVGPSSQDVAAGDALTASQSQSSAAVSIASAGDAAMTSIYGNYFNYLSNAGSVASQTALGTAAYATNVADTASNNALALGTVQANDTLAATTQGYATSQNLALINSSTQENLATTNQNLNQNLALIGQATNEYDTNSAAQVAAAANLSASQASALWSNISVLVGDQADNSNVIDNLAAMAQKTLGWFSGGEATTVPV